PAAFVKDRRHRAIAQSRLAPGLRQGRATTGACDRSIEATTERAAAPRPQSGFVARTETQAGTGPEPGACPRGSRVAQAAALSAGTARASPAPRFCGCKARPTD